MSSRASFARHLQCLCAGIALLGGVMAALASCSQGDSPPPAAAPDSNQGLPRIDGRDAGTATATTDPCSKSEQPGCPCDTEGAHLVCGKVVVTLHDQLVCGQGVSVCTLGSWSECSLNNGDLTSITVTDQTPGASLQSLGSASACASNPCDPYCVTYSDTTSGLQNAGTNISVNTTGLSTITQPTSNCTPATCTSLGKNCGPASDSCGGLLSCGSCTSPQTCGGGGIASVCGTNPACTPPTFARRRSPALRRPAPRSA